MKYSDFFWKHIDTLSSDTSLAHSFGEKVWNHQQQEIDRLNCLLADLHKTCMNIKDGNIREDCQEYDKGWRDCAVAIRTQIEYKWKLIK